MDYQKLFADLLRVFLGFFWVTVCYKGGCIIVEQHKNRWKSCAIALGISATLALVAWSGYGTHTEDRDPLFGGGDTVVDFEPTAKQRNTHGAFVLFVTVTPMLWGVFRARPGGESKTL